MGARSVGGSGNSYHGKILGAIACNPKSETCTDCNFLPFRCRFNFLADGIGQFEPMQLPTPLPNAHADCSPFADVQLPIR
jgi:hypothetical protein